MKHTIKSLILIIFLLFSHASFAKTYTGKITSLGGHLKDGTSFISLDLDTPVGAGYGCSSKSIRWNSKSEHGKYFQSIFMMALASGNKVTLNIQGCYSLQPRYPTFSWGYITSVDEE